MCLKPSDSIQKESGKYPYPEGRDISQSTMKITAKSTILPHPSYGNLKKICQCWIKILQKGGDEYFSEKYNAYHQS